MKRYSNFFIRSTTTKNVDVWFRLPVNTGIQNQELYSLRYFFYIHVTCITAVDVPFGARQNLSSDECIWATYDIWQNQQTWVCAQRRLRSAWASAQSQSPRCLQEEPSDPELPIERTAKTLIRLGVCPGWSESLLGANSFCLFCDVVAHIIIVFTCFPS